MDWLGTLWNDVKGVYSQQIDAESRQAEYRILADALARQNAAVAVAAPVGSAGMGFSIPPAVWYLGAASLAVLVGIKLIKS